MAAAALALTVASGALDKRGGPRAADPYARIVSQIIAPPGQGPVPTLSGHMRSPAPASPTPTMFARDGRRIRRGARRGPGLRALPRARLHLHDLPSAGVHGRHTARVSPNFVE